MDLDFITNNEAALTPQQFVIRQLWDIIKRHEDLDFDDYHLNHIDELWLHTIGDLTYYNGEILSIDTNLAACIAAFNILRGQLEDVYQNQRHFDFEQNMAETEMKLQDSCGVLPDEEMEEETEEE